MYRKKRALRAVGPHTCVVCASRLLFSFGNCPRKGSYYEIGRQKVYLFNLFYGEAVAQAVRGCHFMKWLVTIPSASSSCQLRAALSEVGVTQVYFEWVNDVEKTVLGGVEALTLCAAKRDAAASEILSRPPNMYPSSQETMVLIRSWLQNCSANHEECSQSNSSNLYPRRLLEISGDGTMPTLRVIACSDMSTFPYAALSYCWGGSQRVVLQRENYAALSKKLEYDALPQTVKDAVQITRNLGLGHLWIDALCIIQDDPLDKSEEISRMAEIYEQARITISAARAACSEDGFLQPRQIAKEESFQIPFMCQDGRLGSILLWRHRHFGWHEPIDTRGWTLQKSLMSPRILEFGNHQVRWRCHSKNLQRELTDGWTPSKISNVALDIDWDASAEHHMGLSATREVPVSPWIDRGWRFRRGLAHLLQRSSGHPVPLGITGADFIVTWEDIVEYYSHRGLTNPEDKLLAISAIARKLQRLSNNEYVAGLWKHALPRLLLWSVRTTGKRPPKYVALSWSWASIIGQVQFAGVTAVDIEVINVSLETLVPNDIFSQVTGGTLQVQGMVSEVIIRPYQEEHPIINYHRVSFWEPASGNVNIGDGYLDLSADDTSQEIWNQRLLILRVDHTQGLGLILKKIWDGKYVRVGRFDSIASNPNFNLGWQQISWRERTIVII